MKMSNPGLCCDECFAHIAKMNTSAAILWLDLCELQLSCEVFGVRERGEMKSICLLENLGFLVTTDTDDHTIIKVLGLTRENNNTFFCTGKCNE